MLVKLVGHLLDVFLGKLEVLGCEVFSLVVKLLGLWDDGIASGQAVVQDDLACCSIVLLCKVSNEAILPNVVTNRSRLAADASKRTVADRNHVVIHQELDKILLRTLWIQAYLVAHWLDVSVGQQICYHGHIEIGHC